jgi:hypothetical protein
MTRLANYILGAALVLPAVTMASRAPGPGEPAKLADTELDQVTAGGTLPLDLGGLLDTAGQGLSGNLWIGPIGMTPGTNVPPGASGNPRMMRPLVPSVSNLDAYRLGPPPSL